MPGSGDEPATMPTALAFDWSKRITPDLGLSAGGTYLSLDLDGGQNQAGWGAPFNQMIPIVAFNCSTALNRGVSGTTGTVNRGILWAIRSTAGSKSNRRVAGFLYCTAPIQIPVRSACANFCFGANSATGLADHAPDNSLHRQA